VQPETVAHRLSDKSTDSVVVDDLDQEDAE